MVTGCCERLSFAYVELGFITFILLLTTIPFLALLGKKFRDIMIHYSTISSYCSDPGSYGNRFLLAVTSFIGLLLAFAYVQEYNSRCSDTESQNVRFWLKLVFAFLLPLVGLFYTDGSSKNEYYDLGFVHLPIMLSTLIHSISALLYFIGNTIFNIWYSVEIWKDETTYSRSTADVLLGLSCLGGFIAIVFFCCQGIITLLPIATTAKARYKQKVLEQYKLQGERAGAASLRNVVANTTDSDLKLVVALHIVSFISELLLVLDITLVTMLVSLARNTHIAMFKR